MQRENNSNSLEKINPTEENTLIPRSGQVYRTPKHLSSSLSQLDFVEKKEKKEKKFEDRRNGRLIASRIRGTFRRKRRKVLPRPDFEHGYCRAVGRPSRTSRAAQSFRQEEIKVAFERASARCSISPPIPARSNVRALIVHWFYRRRKERGRKKREKRNRGPLLVR